MRKLDDVGSDTLRSALNEAGSAKAAKRLMVALAYKDGVTVETISTRYAIPQSTVYYWLSRFEERPIEEAITDEDEGVRWVGTSMGGALGIRLAGGPLGDRQVDAAIARGVARGQVEHAGEVRLRLKTGGILVLGGRAPVEHVDL